MCESWCAELPGSEAGKDQIREALDTIPLFTVVTAIVAMTIRDRLSSDPDPIDELHAQYERGEIDEQELEAKIAFHVDDRNEQIRAIVEDVSGIFRGPKQGDRLRVQAA